MKKLVFALIFFVCILCSTSTAMAAQAPLLNPNATFTATFGGTASITDANRNTKIAINGQNEIKIESSYPIHSVYIEWDDIATERVFYAKDIIIDFNSNVFLHEYNALPSPTDELTLKINGGVICDIYVFGEGEEPSYVQKWQPSYTDADMLVFPTHADDEHLYFGGALPVYSEHKKVQVVYFTNHNGEKFRRHELLDGLWAVGITAYPVISQERRDAYADTIEQAKAIYPEEETLQDITLLLRRFKPEVVLMHDFNGEYGHGAHKYNAYIMAKALELANSQDSYQAGQYIEPHDVEKAYFHLYEERPIVMDWSVPLERFGGKTGLEMAKIGYDAHKSQHRWSFAVEDFGPYDCRKFGLYRTTVGDDVNKNDFFENITAEMFSDYIAPEPEPIPEPKSEPSVISSQGMPAAEPSQTDAKTIFMATGIPLVLAVLAMVIASFNKKKK